MRQKPEESEAAVDPVLARELLDEVSDGVYFLDAERRITYWSRGAERITGFSAEEVLGRNCSENLLVHSDCTSQPLCDRDTCPAVAVMREGSNLAKQIFLKHRDGHRIPVDTRVKPICNSEGSVIGVAEIFTVATDATAAESRLRELEELALLDPLTGVGNRRFGEKELSDRLSEIERYGWTFGAVFLDVDRFKQFNDVHGHDVGDRVLKMVAQTLSHNVRSFDAVTRWGGEEFLVLLRSMTVENLGATAEKLRALVASGRVSHGPFRLQATVSVGATLALPGETAESLVRRADKLMYVSKQSGGNRVTLDTEPAADRLRPASNERSLDGADCSVA